jgi:hypothetical protein
MKPAFLTAPAFRFYNQRFLCDYEMAWYPFDVQRCRLLLSMRRAFSPFTKLAAEGMSYGGPSGLTKYEVMETRMEVRVRAGVGYSDKVVSWEGGQAVAVTVVLGRKLLGVLLNVFVPTTILTLIGFSTNFYKVGGRSGSS